MKTIYSAGLKKNLLPPSTPAPLGAPPKRRR